MSVKDDLIAARALIDTPEKWIKYDYHNATRTSFCAVGACDAALGLNEAARLRAIHALESALPGKWDTVSEYNDAPRRRHQDIMRLFDRAIEAAE